MSKKRVTELQKKTTQAGGRKLGATGERLAHLAADVPEYVAIGEKLVPETKARAR